MVQTNQISWRAQHFPAEEVGVAEAEDTVGEGELDGEINDLPAKFPQLDLPVAVPRPRQI